MLNAKNQSQADIDFGFTHEFTYVTVVKWHNYRYEDQIGGC